MTFVFVTGSCMAATMMKHTLERKLNILITCILCLIFVWQSWSTILKYQALRTTLQVSAFKYVYVQYYAVYTFRFSLFLKVTYKDKGSILFPSITFCRDRMFKEEIAFKKEIMEKLKPGYLPIPPNKTAFRQFTLSREQLFMNVSHDTLTRKFKNPCTAVSGIGSGSPCIFPFKYPDCLEMFQII